LIWFD